MNTEEMTQQLRSFADHFDRQRRNAGGALLREAADRIDALEGALRDILAVRPLGDETSDLMIYSSLSAQKSAIARALLASESLNTGEPGNG